jgi:hypothetical protein
MRPLFVAALILIVCHVHDARRLFKRSIGPEGEAERMAFKQIRNAAIYLKENFPQSNEIDSIKNKSENLLVKSGKPGDKLDPREDNVTKWKDQETVGNGAMGIPYRQLYQGAPSYRDAVESACTLAKDIISETRKIIEPGNGNEARILLNKIAEFIGSIHTVIIERDRKSKPDDSHLDVSNTYKYLRNSLVFELCEFSNDMYGYMNIKPSDPRPIENQVEEVKEKNKVAKAQHTAASIASAPRRGFYTDAMEKASLLFDESYESAITLFNDFDLINNGARTEPFSEMIKTFTNKYNFRMQEERQTEKDIKNKEEEKSKQQAEREKINNETKAELEKDNEIKVELERLGAAAKKLKTDTQNIKSKKGDEKIIPAKGYIQQALNLLNNFENFDDKIYGLIGEIYNTYIELENIIQVAIGFKDQAKRESILKERNARANILDKAFTANFGDPEDVNEDSLQKTLAKAIVKHREKLAKDCKDKKDLFQSKDDEFEDPPAEGRAGSKNTSAKRNLIGIQTPNNISNKQPLTSNNVRGKQASMMQHEKYSDTLRKSVRAKQNMDNTAKNNRGKIGTRNNAGPHKTPSQKMGTCNRMQIPGRSSARRDRLAQGARAIRSNASSRRMHQDLLRTKSSMFRHPTRRNPRDNINRQKVVDRPIDVMRNKVGRPSSAINPFVADALKNRKLQSSETATPRKNGRGKSPTANRDAKNARMHQTPVPVGNLSNSKNCKVKFNRLPEMRQVRPRISSGKDARQNPVANVGKQPVKPKVTANDISQARAEKDIEDRNRDFESLFPDVSKLPDPRLADSPTPQNEAEESEDVTEDESRIPVAA